MKNLLNTIMKTFTFTNICIAASFIGAASSILSLIYINDTAFFIMFLLTSLMVIATLIVINSGIGVKKMIENGQWSNAMRRDLAKEFSRLLRQELTREEIVELIRRNIDYRLQGFKGMCASHEFLDANMTMHEAFENVFKFSPFENSMDCGTVELWNSSWRMAVNHELNEYNTL